MIDKLYTKAGTWVDWYAGKSLRKDHPARAAVLDTAVIATWTCWLIALLIAGYYVLTGNASELLRTFQ